MIFIKNEPWFVAKDLCKILEMVISPRHYHV
ncbi:hypothetical protein [Brevibacillus laterosporus]